MSEQALLEILLIVFAARVMPGWMAAGAFFALIAVYYLKF